MPEKKSLASFLQIMSISFRSLPSKLLFHFDNIPRHVTRTKLFKLFKSKTTTPDNRMNFLKLNVTPAVCLQNLTVKELSFEFLFRSPSTEG